MFRALTLAHHQEVHVVIVYVQPLVSSLSAGDCPVYRLGESFLNPLAYTDFSETAGLASSINTQPAVRRNSVTNPTSQHNRGMYWSQ